MSRAWIAFYMGDYQRDTQHLTTEQHGAYFLLLQHCWQHGQIPSEASSRAAVAKMTPAQWKRIAPVINSFFQDDGTNKRATAEIEKAEVVRTRKQLAGRQGGLRSGVSRSIKHGEAIKREAETKHSFSRNEAQTKHTGSCEPSYGPSVAEPKHNSKITTSSFGAAREGETNSDRSLATALPAGALRERSGSEPVAENRLVASLNRLSEARGAR